MPSEHSYIKALSRRSNTTPGTQHAYANRLLTILQHMQRSQPGLQMPSMLQHGRRLVKAIASMYRPGSSRCAALTAALAVYSANKQLRRGYADSWGALKHAMVNNRCIQAQRYKTGEASARQRVNYVSMPQILNKLEQLTAEGAFCTDFTAHQRWLLVGCYHACTAASGIINKWCMHGTGWCLLAAISSTPTATTHDITWWLLMQPTCSVQLAQHGHIHLYSR
jgi:hypothetical protein